MKAKKKTPMSLNEAIRYVQYSLTTLDDLARGFRGCVRSETKEAFRIVIKAARESKKRPGGSASSQHPTDDPLTSGNDVLMSGL